MTSLRQIIKLNIKGSNHIERTGEACVRIVVNGLAHLILRWVAIIERPHKPHFAKKLRRRFIFIPGKVVEHARQVCMKIPERFYQEVMRLKEAWQSSLRPAPAWASG